MLQSSGLRLNRYLGCMVGGAAGDALGRATEGLSRQQIRAKYGHVTEFQTNITRRGNFPPGVFTDDTHLALITAESLISQDQLNIDHLAASFIAALHQDLGIAGTTRRALELREQGKEIGVLKRGRHAGAGAATRVIPLALFRAGDLSALNQEAEAVARITHVDEDAVAGAVITAFAVAWMARGETRPDQLMAKLVSLAEHKKSNLAYTLAYAQQLLAMEVKTEDGLEEIGADGAAVRLIPSALYSFLNSPNSFLETIVAAANAGGDADTRAAIAGSLSGAYNGLDLIPSHFVRKLDQSSRIMNIAQSLYQIAAGGKDFS